jgi:non-ribosomal peptide synthetase component E (peptide arylation enzyme)
LEELTAYLGTKKISKNKWPERLEIIEEMPLTPTRKVMKGSLLALLEGGVG